MNKIKIFQVLILFLLTSCTTSNRPTGNRPPRNREKTYTKPYKKAEAELKIQLFLYHGLNNTSFVYYQLENSQLVYTKSDTSKLYTSKVRVSYKMMVSPDAKQVIDSGTVFINDSDVQQPQSRILIGYIPLNVNDGQESYLELRILDLYGKKTNTRYIHCLKQDVYSQQNFFIQGAGKEVLFTNKIEQGKIVTISNQRATFNKARINFYATDYSLPPPPYSSREPDLYPAVPDSVFDITATDQHSFQLNILRQGVYFVRLDDNAAGGCFLLGVEQNFPMVQTHAQMIAATRYIMNREEFEKMNAAADKKSAIDAFWLGIGGNPDRAKQLIKRYYGRVQEANTLFTSHIEGWKTDMGMIYMLFGSPAKTYKTSGMETWVYGQEGTPNSVTFRFEKINNPFSENCYKLQRSPVFKDTWTIAADNWREGRVNLED